VSISRRIAASAAFGGIVVASIVAANASALSQGGTRWSATTCTQKAKAALDGASKPMRYVVPKRPVSVSKIQGKTFWYIAPVLSSATAVNISNGFKAAAAAAGAKAHVFDGQGNVTQWNQGLTEAVTQGAAGVVLQGENPSLVSGPLATAFSQKIPVIDALNGNSSDPLNGLFAHVTPNFSQTGKLQADYVLATTHCHANIAIFNQPVYPGLVLDANGVKAEMQRLCPSCPVTEQDVAAAGVATSIPSLVQNVVHANPKINFIVSAADGMAFFMPAALQQIGSKVRVVGSNGTLPNLQNVAQNIGQVADVGLPPLAYIGWLMFDELARAAAGQPNASFALPQQVFYSANLNIKHIYPKFGPYQSAFKKLWGVT
jgi:ribose transport system substrate-binding protein